jgi:translation elongation factor EF-Tu-like GTPase
VGLLATGLKQSEVRRGMSKVKPKSVEQLNSSTAQVRNMMINTTRSIIFTL